MTKHKTAGIQCHDSDGGMKFPVWILHLKTQSSQQHAIFVQWMHNLWLVAEHVGFWCLMSVITWRKLCNYWTMIVWLCFHPWNQPSVRAARFAAIIKIRVWCSVARKFGPKIAFLWKLLSNMAVIHRLLWENLLKKRRLAIFAQICL